MKVIAHSMGGKYAKGYIEALINYAHEHLSECKGLMVTEYDFASFQQNKQRKVKGSTLFQYDNKADNVVGGL